MEKKRIVFFTGAGISAESGLKTFRDNDGLWEEYNVYEVATTEAWESNPELVLEFYNKRRTQLLTVEPNEGHIKIAELQEFFDVSVITQNVDDLHERSGVKQVMHLHGELMKVRSSLNESLIYDTHGKNIYLGDKAEDGEQLRPHVVWFGEAVPAMEEAIEMVQQAEFLVVVGTSLQVYPAAGLLNFVNASCKTFYIDPMAHSIYTNENVVCINEKASIGISILAQTYLE